MHMWTGSGRKIRYINAKMGRECDHEYARKYIQFGGTYTVERMSIGSSGTYVALREVPGQEFNSVMFENCA